MRISLVQCHFLALLLLAAMGCTDREEKVSVSLKHGEDTSAGGGAAYVITTPAAVYYLDKAGGGLSSMVDPDGVDWLGFNSAEGSGHKGEYRGFPNAVHRQDGSYFHAMNAGTDPSTSTITKESPAHLQIRFTSDNGKWQSQWDFYPERCDFTMQKISPGYRYWVQYEGVPGGTMDSTDYWFASADEEKHAINEPFLDDLPHPEWMAFGDQTAPRTLYLLHHEDDDHPDNYVSRPDMTVLGFGRQNKDKFLVSKQTFSIGFTESTNYEEISQVVAKALKTTSHEN